MQLNKVYSIKERWELLSRDQKSNTKKIKITSTMEKAQDIGKMGGRKLEIFMFNSKKATAADDINDDDDVEANKNSNF